MLYFQRQEIVVHVNIILWAFSNCSMFINVVISEGLGLFILLIHTFPANSTTGEAQELVKHFINNKPEQGYRNAMELLRRHYGNPYRLLAAYRIKIKHMSPIKKPGDISAFRKLLNFLIKCQSLCRSSQNNPLDTSEIICMILSRVASSSPR